MLSFVASRLCGRARDGSLAAVVPLRGRPLCYGLPRDRQPGRTAVIFAATKSSARLGRAMRHSNRTEPSSA
jgi:hypothetical protein